MKRLLLIWTRGDRAVRVSASQKKEISARLLSLRDCIPSAFVRKPRGLEELDRWKATEFRQFLLYTGKIVLKGILPDDVYLHFLSFNVAMAILVCPSLVQEHSKYANELLQYFVEKGRTLYGQEFLVYNTHTMLHIASDAENFGCLENCSAFMFENYLQSLKKMVRSGRHPLIQVSKRLEEMSKQKKTPNKTNVQKISTRARDCAYILSGGRCCDYETAKKWSKRAAVQSSVESSDDVPKRKKRPVCLSSSDEDHLLSLLTQRIICIESEMKAMRSSTAALYELYARALGDGTSQRVEEMNLDVCGTMEELLSLEGKIKEETFRNRVTHHLSLIGGPNPGENTRRVMRALASYSVWKGFSLKGKKGKRPLLNMNIMKVIKTCPVTIDRTWILILAACPDLKPVPGFRHQLPALNQACL
ncbi:unnamed protein product [Leuciscus chuanchicus]